MGASEEVEGDLGMGNGLAPGFRREIVVSAAPASN